MLTPESAARKDRTTGQSTTMQHRHMAFIADVLAELTGFSDFDRFAIADRFANALARSNPRFDRARFLAACGVQS